MDTFFDYIFDYIYKGNRFCHSLLYYKEKKRKKQEALIAFLMG